MFEGRGALKINNNAGRHHVMSSKINPYSTQFWKIRVVQKNLKKNHMQEFVFHLFCSLEIPTFWINICTFWTLIVSVYNIVLCMHLLSWGIISTQKIPLPNLVHLTYKHYYLVHTHVSTIRARHIINLSSASTLQKI